MGTDMKTFVVAAVLTVGAEVAAQQVVVASECFAELGTAGGTPVRQAVAAGTVLSPGMAYALQIDHPNGASVATIRHRLTVDVDRVTLTSSGSASFPPAPVAGAAGGELLVTLPPMRGILHLVGEAGVTGGPGTGVSRFEVDVLDDGTTDFVVFPFTYTWRGEHDVFVDTAAPIPVRIRVQGDLLSWVLDHFYGFLTLDALPGACPDTSYGVGCTSLTAEPGPGRLDYSFGSAPAFVVFGFQAVDLPIAGSACRQRVSLDVVAGVFTGTYRLTLPPLPAGFQLFAQTASFAGGTIQTSNGIALVCPP